MKKIAPILVLILMLGIVGISGCTSSNNTQTSSNDSNSSYAATNSEPATTSSVNKNTDNSSLSDDHSSNLDNSSSSSESTATSGSYIANANTGVFHYSWCRYVSRMKDSNKVYFSSSTAAENAGYRPCKICNP